MDQQQFLIDWLKKDLNEIKTEIKKDILEINAKVDQLLKFKFQIIGGSVIISAVLATAIQLISIFWKN